MASNSDPHLGRILESFKTAIGHLDSTEPQIRDLIERHLIDVDTMPGTVKEKSAKIEELMGHITRVRTAAVKKAFRHLRDNLPSHHVQSKPAAK